MGREVLLEVLLGPGGTFGDTFGSTFKLLRLLASKNGEIVAISENGNCSILRSVTAA